MNSDKSDISACSTFRACEYFKLYKSVIVFYFLKKLTLTTTPLPLCMLLVNADHFGQPFSFLEINSLSKPVIPKVQASK